MPATTALTIKQRRFLKHYLKSGNGTQAALVAYDVTDANTAKSIATENLRKPALRTALAALLYWHQRHRIDGGNGRRQASP
jgi:phage terminase small subunit